MEKILRLLTDCRGNETAAAILTQEGGLLRLWEVNCYSSKDLGLGNCQCVNHPASIETPVSTEEVIARFGIDALDGFEAPEEEQLTFDAFGIEINELETFLRVSYMLGVNPLPTLRDKGANVVFAETTEGLVITGAEPGEVVFVVNSRGEISVREA